MSAPLILIIVGVLFCIWVGWEALALRQLPIASRASVSMEGRGNPVEGLHAVEAAVRTSLTAPLDLDRPEGRPRNIGKLPKERAGTPSGSVASGVVTAALLGADWWRSDDSVMKAVARLTKTEITNGLDLRRTLRAEGYQLDNPHFQHFLRGHVGEADVFAMLEASGTPIRPQGSRTTRDTT